MKLISTLLAASLLAASALSVAQTGTPVVTERQINQAARINQGVKSGELNKLETRALRTEQRAIQAEKKAFKADGKVTAAERVKLQRDQNAASRHIANQKHDAQKRLK